MDFQNDWFLLLFCRCGTWVTNSKMAAAVTNAYRSLNNNFCTNAYFLVVLHAAVHDSEHPVSPVFVLTKLKTQ